MKLTVLGMNGPFPAANGATSGYLLEHDGHRILLDMGTGTLARLTALCAPEALDTIVFSHWHSDHCSDVLPMLYRLNKRGTKLDVYGPMDENAPVRKALEADAMVALHTIAAGDTLSVGGLTLTVGPARHPVPAVSMRWTDGSKTIVYTGDTNTIDGLAAFVQDADLLLADGLFPKALWKETLPHLSAEHCAALANAANVGHCIITHMNPDIDAQICLAEAQALRPETVLAEPGMVWEA